MNKLFKKSLFAGMLVLGIFTFANQQHASAKSYAKVTSNVTMTTEGSLRNVNFTGTNALYDKVGTTKGAKLIATLTTVNNLKELNYGQKNIRAYRVATTNRGSVYYKVVTFDGKYRGWIYGGNSTNQFGGGLTSYETTQNSPLNPGEEYQADGKTMQCYNFKTPGTQNNGEELTYAQPMWTQYKVGRQVMDTTPYANDELRIVSAKTRSREGDRWVYVSDLVNPQVSGWIRDDALVKVNHVPVEIGVTVDYVDVDTLDTVSTHFFPLSDTNGTVNLTQHVSGGPDEPSQEVMNYIPDGYEKGIAQFNSQAMVNNAKNAKNGYVIKVLVQKSSPTTTPTDINPMMDNTPSVE